MNISGFLFYVEFTPVCVCVYVCVCKIIHMCLCKHLLFRSFWDTFTDSVGLRGSSQEKLKH
jgi:hypothetical protein